MPKERLLIVTRKKRALLIIVTKKKRDKKWTKRILVKNPVQDAIGSYIGTRSCSGLGSCSAF